jgi:hypothetical protein
VQGWLLGAYLDLAGLRVIIVLLLKTTSAGQESRFICFIVLLVGLFIPFLFAWMILGTVWYVQAVKEECVSRMQLPKEEKPWLFALLLVVGYSILALFLLITLTTCLRVAYANRHHRDLARSLVVIPDDSDPERPLDAEELQQLTRRHLERYREGRDITTCTICCEDFTVSLSRAGKRCSSCLDVDTASTLYVLLTG